VGRGQIVPPLNKEKIIMAKYKVLRDCYGFQNRYWEKGEIAEIDPKDNPSQHFERMDKKIVEEETKEVIAPSEIQREELLVEAKGKGIKDADVLNSDELLEVLADDITKKKIAEIVEKAKKRK